MLSYELKLPLPYCKCTCHYCSLTGGASSDSIKLFYYTNVKLHGLTNISYDLKKVWSDDPLVADQWVAARWTRDYYLAHCRYIHFADNESYVVESNDDRACKTRELREKLQMISQGLMSPEQNIAIDEGNLDTESPKVFNRQRLRFKPSANEGVCFLF